MSNRILSIVLAWIFCGTCTSNLLAASPKMRAHFINIGQGASALLEFPCGAVLIDAGAQDEEHADHLADYLSDFFSRRADLNNTLAAVFITHPHIDHDYALNRVAAVCRIQRFIDDAVIDPMASGGRPVNWIRGEVAAGRLSTVIRGVNNTEIPAQGGLTDDVIDPLMCDTCDPRIVVLSASFPTNPGWSNGDFKNLNNQSVVIRVDFGASSFLFTGDLQEKGIQTLLQRYQGTSQLDTDVYHVGHHGSHNATTPALLAAMTPRFAVIGVGKWDYGKTGPTAHSDFTTFKFGHPRRVIVEMLAAAIPGDRPTPRDVKVFDAVQSPSSYHVTKNIYATGWDGDIVLEADLDGNLAVDSTGEHLETPHIARAPRAARADERSLSPASASLTPLPLSYDSVPPEDLVSQPAPIRTYVSAPARPPSFRTYHRGCLFLRRRCR